MCGIKQHPTTLRTHPALQSYGWKQPDPSTLSIDWDSELNITQIKDRVSLIQRGCGCKTGCQNACCKCRKGGRHCGPGCKCQGCVNVLIQQSDLDLPSSLESEESDVDLEKEVDNIMDDVFGEKSDFEVIEDDNMDLGLLTGRPC